MCRGVVCHALAMVRVPASIICSLGCWLIACAGYSRPQDLEQFKKDEQAWQVGFSLIEQPILLDTKGLTPPITANPQIAERNDDPLPLPPSHIGLWAQSVGRRVIGLPGGYVFHHTIVSNEFGSTLPQFWILQWINSLDQSQAELLTAGAPLHSLDSRGRAVMNRASGSFPGGFAEMMNPQGRMTTQLAASITLEVTLPNGDSSRREVSSHAVPQETQVKNDFPPSPLPPYTPPPLNPKSIPLEFGKGQLTSIYHLARQMYDEARILLRYDPRHTNDPIFIKGTWDSYALIEAIRRYHESEPLVAVEFEDQYSMFASVFESTFDKVANSGEDDFRKLAALAESGQSLTWDQLKRDFPKIAEEWDLTGDSAPSPQTQVRLERGVGMKVFGRDQDNRYMGGAFYSHSHKPALPPRPGS